jgi:hypothetical protein
MPTLEEQLEEVRSTLEDLRARLKALEQKSSAPRPEKVKDKWDKLGVFSPLVTGIVLAVVAYFLTGSINLALQKQQLELSGARETRELVSSLSSRDTSREEAEATAITLAAFGRPAILPLVNTLESGGEVRRPAAERALQLLGLTHQDETCAALQRVLENRAGVYSWETHAATIRLLGQLACGNSLPAVEDYHRLVAAAFTDEGLKTYTSIIRHDPEFKRDRLPLLQQDLNQSLALLRRAPR